MRLGPLGIGMLVAWLCACGGGMRSSAGRVEVSADEFTGARMVTLEGMAMPNREGLGVHTLSLMAPPGAGVADLTITHEEDEGTWGGGAPSWQYLRCHSLDILADGNNIAFPETTHDGQVVNGGTSISLIETVSAPIALADLDKMVRARSLRGRICNTVFEFLPETRTGLENFVRAVRGQPLREARPPARHERRPHESSYAPGF